MKYLTNSGLSYFLNKIKAYLTSSTYLNSIGISNSEIDNIADDAGYSSGSLPASEDVFLTGDIIPNTDNSVDLGASSKNIKMIYTKGITINGTQFLPSDYIPKTGSNQISGDLVPATDNSIDIGSSTSNIKMLYTKGITIDTKTIDIDANGNMTFNGNEVLTSAIKESSISNLSGWCLLHGGLLIQWGTAAHEGASFTINFNKPFSTLPIVTICYGQPDNRPVPCSVNSDATVTTTSFTAYGPSAFAWRINWIAIGKGA